MPFSPVADRPSYSKPESFVNKEVVVGSGAFPLPGTLSVPKGKRVLSQLLSLCMHLERPIRMKQRML